MVAVNDFDVSPPPLLSIIRSPAGARCLLSAKLPESLARDLAAMAAHERVDAVTAPWPVHRTRYRELLESFAPISREYGGPAFVLPELPYSDGNIARVLSHEDRALLSPHFDWLIAKFETAEPVAGVIEDGAVVSICRCARNRTAAVEAGIETAPEYRGRGFAKHAAARWASAIRARNMIPLYSTSWDNIASQRIAAALGAEQYAVDYNLR